MKVASNLILVWSIYACDATRVHIQVDNDVCLLVAPNTGGDIDIKLPVELGVIVIYACTNIVFHICLYVALLTVNTDVVIPQSLAGVRFVHAPVKF